MSSRRYQSLCKRIAAIEAIIEQYENAVLELSNGAIKSYDWAEDGRQQSVTYLDVSKLQKTINSLYATLEQLYADPLKENTGNPKVVVRAY
jgi:hypothetical protein